MTEILQENTTRNELLDEYYNPTFGVGSLIDRFPFKITEGLVFNLPVEMKEDPIIKIICEYDSIEKFIKGNKNIKQLEPTIQLVLDTRDKYDFEYWAFSKVKIKPKDGGDLIPFKLNKPQRRVLARLEKMRLARKPIRMIILKARQWGGSTLVQLYMAWIQILHKTNWNSLIAAEINQQATNIRYMYSNMVKHYPGKITLKPFEGMSNIKIIPERSNKITVGSMQTPESVRSDDVAMAHLCIHTKTEIPTENGFTKRADEIKPGDKVITHTGAETLVKNVTISSPTKLNGNGQAIKVKAWGQCSVTLTPNHPVFTQRGWVNARDLKKEDLLSYPVRKVTNKVSSITLPIYTHRKHGGGKIPKLSGKSLSITEELGYFFGYFLAEGSVHVYKGRVSESSFTRHDDEAEYADKALSAIKGFGVRMIRKKRPNTKTTQEFIYDVALSRFLYDNIGAKEFKTLPDWFFDCGTDFLRGVLVGYLHGDGSKTDSKQGKYTLTNVTATSISSSIAMQIKDISIALGYGVPSIETRKAGVYYNRNCKKKYVVRWTGSSGRKIRSVSSQEYPNNGHKYSEKSKIENGYAWMKIKSLSKTTIKKVVDIEVEHTDHSFRTYAFSVKNSEVAFWKKTEGKEPKDLAQAILGTIPSKHNTLYVLESTAKGVGNYFHNVYTNAVEQINNLDPVFVPWFEIEIYRDKFEDKQELTDFHKSLDDYEIWLWSIGATLEGIKWYRGKLREFDGDTWRMRSEFPSSAIEAFQSTGRRVYAPSIVEKTRLNCVPPQFKGHLYADGNKGDDALKNISFEESANGELWIWELPDKSITVDHRYLVTIDIGGKSKDADWSVIRVLDRYWMMYAGVPEFVATYKIHIDQDLLAWLAVQVGEFYNHAMVAFENNSLRKYENTEGAGFLTLLNEVAEHYDNLYIKSSPQDAVKEGMPVKYGFHTNRSSKDMIINYKNAAMRDDEYIERDSRACDESDQFERKSDDTVGAVDGGHDDIEMSTDISLWISQYDMPLPYIVDLEKAKENRLKNRKRIINESSF